MDQSGIFPQGRCFPSLSFLQNSLTLGKYSSIRTLLGQKCGGKVLCGNKNPNKLKRSIVVGQEIIQPGAELGEHNSDLRDFHEYLLAIVFTKQKLLALFASFLVLLIYLD